MPRYIVQWQTEGHAESIQEAVKNARVHLQDDQMDTLFFTCREDSDGDTVRVYGCEVSMQGEVEIVDTYEEENVL